MYPFTGLHGLATKLTIIVVFTNVMVEKGLPGICSPLKKYEQWNLKFNILSF